MPPRTVDIYSSLPLNGPLAADAIPLVNGIRLALAQYHSTAGAFRVHYVSLDDATPATKNWTLAQAEANARRATADPRSIYYIGDFASGATEVSIPILNEADIPQVSPASTDNGLTTTDPGAGTSDPLRLLPSFRHTFLRIVPRESIEAAADLEAMKQAGCTRIAIAHDAGGFGAGQADDVAGLAQAYNLAIVSDVQFGAESPSLIAYAALMRLRGVDCLLYDGTSVHEAVDILDAVHAAIPTAKLFGPHTVCTPALTNAAIGGVPRTADPLVYCTSLLAPAYAYPGGPAFLAAYQRAYAVRNPSAYALYGYEAMKLGLDTIARLGGQGDSRSAVLAALFAIHRRNSVLGPYRFQSTGDTTLTTYGLYKVGSDGDPVFYTLVRPSKVP